MLQRLLLVFNGTGEVLRPAPLFDHGASFDIGECRWLPRRLQLETFLRPRLEAMLEAAARLELKAASGSPRRRKRHSHDAGLCPQGGEGCTRNSGLAGRRPEAGIAGSATPAPQRKPEAFGRRSSSACGKLLTCRGLLSRMNTLRLAAVASPGFACPERGAETGRTCVPPETSDTRSEAFSRFLTPHAPFRNLS